MTQTWDAWLPVVPALAEHFSVAAVDLRGHGQSDHPASGYHLRDYVADVVALTDALGWRQPLVIGHSLGGSVARLAEARHPGWAHRIVIEDTPPRLDRADTRVTLLAKGYLKMQAMPPEGVEAHFHRVNPGWTEAQVHDAALSLRERKRQAGMEPGHELGRVPVVDRPRLGLPCGLLAEQQQFEQEELLVHEPVAGRGVSLRSMDDGALTS